MRGRRGTFGTSIDVSGSLATKGGIFDAAAFDVAGVTLSAPQARFAWQAWHFEHFRLALRGRRGAFGSVFSCRLHDPCRKSLMLPPRWPAIGQNGLLW